MKRTLRPYQKADIRRIYQAWKEHRRVLYVLPTGGGKTDVAAEIAKRESDNGKVVFFLAHRHELLDQARDRLIARGVDADDIGMVIAGAPSDGGRPIQVASIQTLVRRGQLRADVVIIDEAHHASANSYMEILSWSPKAKVLGLTATPWRYTGAPLNDAFDTLLTGKTMSELIDLGFLAHPRVFSAPPDLLPSTAAIKKAMGDFVVDKLSKVVRSGVLIGNLVADWKRRANGRSTVVFTVDVPHSRAIARRFRRAGVSIEHLDGTTTKEERMAILKRFRSGKTKIVTNCMILTEGFDMEGLTCAVLARPTLSLTLYLQQVGRVLRPNAQHCPLILDHSGNASVLGHGLPHDARQYSLFTKTTPLKDAVNGGPSTIVCGNCGEVFHSHLDMCPHCEKWENPRCKRQQETDIELVEIEKVEEQHKQALYKLAFERAKKAGIKKPAVIARAVVEANYAVA